MYFQALAEREKDPICFFDLVACHIRHAANFWHGMNDRMRSGNMRSHYGVEGLRDRLAEGAHMYRDYLPRIAARLSRELEVDASAVYEAWIMLMFRAFGWSCCHFMCASEARYPDSTRLVIGTVKYQYTLAEARRGSSICRIVEALMCLWTLFGDSHMSWVKTFFEIPDAD